MSILRSSRPLLFAVALIALAGCSASRASDPAVRSVGALPVTSAPSEPAAAPATTIDPAAVPISPFASLVTSAGSAIYDPAAAQVGPAPVAVALPSLGVQDARIDAVGVTPNGELEVPDARHVGWYRYGARPGDAGAALLAAHIAFNGVDGVFRHLDRIAPGDTVTITYADGTRRDFTVTTLRQYPKTELPRDLVFGSTGPARVVLVTCGGVFDNSRRSYEDNIVAFAVPA